MKQILNAYLQQLQHCMNHAHSCKLKGLIGSTDLNSCKSAILQVNDKIVYLTQQQEQLHSSTISIYLKRIETDLRSILMEYGTKNMSDFSRILQLDIPDSCWWAPYIIDYFHPLSATPIPAHHSYELSKPIPTNNNTLNTFLLSVYGIHVKLKAHDGSWYNVVGIVDDVLTALLDQRGPSV